MPTRWISIVLVCLLPLGGSVLFPTPAAAQVGSVQKIDDTALAATIASGDRFGFATVSPGDIDNDGIPDLVVGAPWTDNSAGAIYVLLLDNQGGVKSDFKFSGAAFNGAGTDYRFGHGVAHVGDLNRDGHPDLAVGSPNIDGSTERLRGGVWILFLDYDYSANSVTIKDRQFIGENAGGFGDLGERSFFGRSVSGLGNVDGDRNWAGDLAVGGSEGMGLPGAVWVLLLNSDGTVKSYQKTPNAGPTDFSYGESVAGLGDLNGDGVPDLAVGVPFAPDGGGERGLVRILFLAADGTVSGTQDLRNPESLDGDGSSADGDSFGESIAAVRDVNADGVPDLGVGAYRDDDGGRDRGAFWLLYLNDDATVQAAQKLSDTAGGLTASLPNSGQFGWGAAALDDVDRDGRIDFAVGAPVDDGSGGAVYLLFGNDDLLPQGTPGLPYAEGFETNGLGTRYVAPGRFDGGANDYFRRVVGDFTYSGSIPGAIDGPAYEGYVNVQGEHLWAGEDLDGGNSDGSGAKTLTLRKVDVSGVSAVRFTGRFGANYNESLGSTFDSVDDPSQGITADSLVVRYKIDDQPNFQPGLKFSAVPDDSDYLLHFNNPLAEDTNFNGIGDGPILTPALQDFGFDIPLPAGAQTVTIQIGVYTAESAEETGFDDLRLEAVSDGALPVELAGFSARRDDNRVRLAWQTVAETNNAGFHVERKAPGGWQDLGYVEGHGTTETPQSYRFTDARLPFAADTLTYRLRQVDLDGTTDFSAPVVVRLGVPDRLTLHAPFPNPARADATLRYALPRAADVRIEVFNVLGQRVARLDGQQKAGRTEQRLDTSRLPSGLYFVRLQAGGEGRTERLVVVR